MTNIIFNENLLTIPVASRARDAFKSSIVLRRDETLDRFEVGLAYSERGIGQAIWLGSARRVGAAVALLLAEVAEYGWNNGAGACDVFVAEELVNRVNALLAAMG